jgi:Zn-dependent peptidase ImmA (M78 family)/transcriptional regulator with XRE-family HTH domain
VPTNLQAIATARTARGLSQVDLAQQLGVSQAVYSKLESGLAPLSNERLARIAEKLDLPIEYFEAPETARDEARVFHRKRASLPVQADRRIRAEAAVLQAQLGALLGSELPRLTLPRISPTDNGAVDPTDIADDIRERWGLGNEPIGNFVELLESKGIIVMQHDMQTMRIDAIAMWPHFGQPVIFVSDTAPAARRRFTLAHELGHAIMHDLPRDDQEAEADEFASEFLMPRDGIIGDLQSPTMASLLQLKMKWGTSMWALARRARDLGKMTQREYKSFSIELSSTGMRSHEPGEPDLERPTLVSNSIARRFQDGSSAAEVARSGMMTENDFHRRFLEVPA